MNYRSKRPDDIFMKLILSIKIICRMFLLFFGSIDKEVIINCKHTFYIFNILLFISLFRLCSTTYYLHFILLSTFLILLNPILIITCPYSTLKTY